MSDIQRYEWGPDGMCGQDDGRFVLFTDHEAEIACLEKRIKRHEEDAEDRAKCIAEKDAEIFNAKVFLAYNHGHVGIYLDDGEIQCGSCGQNWDYKSMDILKAAKVAITELTESRDKAEKRVKELEGALNISHGTVESLTKELSDSRNANEVLTAERDAAIKEVGDIARKLGLTEAERDRLREENELLKTHCATSDFCSAEWKNDCDELKDLVSRAARIIETVTPGSREEKDEQELWLEDAKAALERK